MIGHMKQGVNTLRPLALASAVAVAGCVPLPAQVYVPDLAGGKLQHSSCAFNTHVPTGVSLSVQDIDLTVSLGRHEGRHFVEVRFDVPEGKVLQIVEPTAQIATGVPATSVQVRFPKVSLVDTPIMNSFSNEPSVQQTQLPTAAKLVGQRVSAGGTSFNRHFWLATYVEIGDAEDVWVTLAAPVVNGIHVPVPSIHFHRQSMTVVALFNC
jgi:hypothetical protein